MDKSIQVVYIIDQYSVALNVGAIDNVELGQKFLIYTLSKDTIVDPSTGESLGSLEIVKGTGKVTHLQEKLCTISSCEYTTNSNKVITRSPVFGYSETKEKISTDKEQKPFIDVAVGDFAKPI